MLEHPAIEAEIHGRPQSIFDFQHVIQYVAAAVVEATNRFIDWAGA
jgi:hypothetical protein